MKMKCKLSLLAGGSALLYGAYLLGLSAAAPYAITPFGQVPFTDDRFDATLFAVSDDLELPLAIHQGREGMPAVMVYVGNTGARQYFNALWEPLIDAGFTVAIAPYRGAEGVPGERREVNFKADALAALEAFEREIDQPASEISIVGYSLGTGLAAHVASMRDTASLALISPFDTLCSLVTEMVYAPACVMSWVDAWDSYALVPSIDETVFVAHGLKDDLIEPERGARLAEHYAFHGRLSAFHLYPHAGHNSIFTLSPVMDDLIDWIENPQKDSDPYWSDDVVRLFNSSVDGGGSLKSSFRYIR